MIKVYHNTKTDMISDLTDVRVTDLRFVAEVQTDDLEEAYRLTQNIDRPWSQNANVKAEHRENRSTSIGDVLQKGRDFWIVRMDGFYRVGSEEE